MEEHTTNSTLFTHKNFLLKQDGIHLLRNGFDYKTIIKSDMVEVSIERGPQVKNWPILLTMGIGFISFSLYYVIRFIDVLMNTDEIIWIEQFVIPIIPLALGIVCVYNSIRRGDILTCKIKTGKALRIPLLKGVDKVRLESALKNGFKHS